MEIVIEERKIKQAAKEFYELMDDGDEWTRDEVERAVHLWLTETFEKFIESAYDYAAGPHPFHQPSFFYDYLTRARESTTRGHAPEPAA